jgi:hypothetical protein
MALRLLRRRRSDTSNGDKAAPDSSARLNFRNGKRNVVPRDKSLSGHPLLAKCNGSNGLGQVGGVRFQNGVYRGKGICPAGKGRVPARPGMGG